MSKCKSRKQTPGSSEDENEQDPTKATSPAGTPGPLHNPDDPEGGELKGDYDTFKDWEEDFKRYQKETKTTYVIQRSDKISKNHPKADLLMFARRTYVCVHHGTYKAEGAGKRTFTHTRKNQCPASISIKTEKGENVIIINSANLGHNHELTS